MLMLRGRELVHEGNAALGPAGPLGSTHPSQPQGALFTCVTMGHGVAPRLTVSAMAVVAAETRASREALFLSSWSVICFATDPCGKGGTRRL